MQRPCYFDVNLPHGTGFRNHHSIAFIFQDHDSRLSVMVVVGHRDWASYGLTVLVDCAVPEEAERLVLDFASVEMRGKYHRAIAESSLCGVLNRGKASELRLELVGKILRGNDLLQWLTRLIRAGSTFYKVGAC